MTTVTLSVESVQASILEFLIEKEEETISRLTKDFLSKKREIDSLASRIDMARTIRDHHRASLNLLISNENYGKL